MIRAALDLVNVYEYSLPLLYYFYLQSTDYLAIFVWNPRKYLGGKREWTFGTIQESDPY